MLKQIKDVRKDESSSNTFSYTILHEIGSIRNNESTVYKNIIYDTSEGRNNSKNTSRLFIDNSIQEDFHIYEGNDNMVISQLNTNLASFVEKLPNMNPISKPDTLQLPRKISEVRIRNIEQMTLENPPKLNFSQKCLLLYKTKSTKDYILISVILIIIMGIIALIFLIFYL